MAVDAWLPIGFKTPDGEQARVAIFEGPDWQIYSAAGGGRILVAKASLAKRWVDLGILDEQFLIGFNFGDDDLVELSSGTDHQLSPVSSFESPQNGGQAIAFAESFKATREIDQSSSLHDAIYVEKLSRLLPTFSLSPSIEDDVVFGAWLTAGVPVSIKAFRRVRSLTTWMSAPILADIIDRGGFEVEEAGLGSLTATAISGELEAPQVPKGKFELAGRPYLESFFNEHIIDIIEHQERYKKLGIEFPSAIIMHGPPGCGKTFAVERLVDYLGWPSFQIDASSVASPYIHETSKKVSEMFENAIKNAPSVLVIDEMEAFLADRESGGGGSHHRVEEVAEFLRRIPEAVKNQVLIIAMTNRIEMIDPAIMRRGRFDHVIKVDYASEEEVLSLLDNLLRPLPKDETIAPAILAKKLAKRPLSDVSYVVREGARLAARAGQEIITQECLLKALEASPSRDPDATERRIGFM
jgi:cell division protease FtsH